MKYSEYLLIKGANEGEIVIYSMDKVCELSLQETVTYGEFFKRLRDAVKTKSSIEDMKLLDGNLMLDCFSTNENVSFTLNEVKICFSADLWQDESFKGTLEDIASEFKEVSLETKKNIEEKKRAIRERQNFIKEAQSSLTEYFETGKLSAKHDEKFMVAFIDYIDKNKDKIKSQLEEKYLARKHPHFTRLYKIAKFLGVPILIAFLCSCVCDFMLLVLFCMEVLFPYKFFIGFTILTGAITGINISPLFEKINEKLINDLYKILVKKTEIEKEKIESMEKGIENDSLQQDVFLKYISHASFYMLEHNDLDFSKEARELSLLLHSYADAKKEEIAQKTRVDRFKFLGELTKLEIAIYSKNNNKRFLTDYLAKGLDDRLEFLGIAKNVVLSDSALNDVFKTIKRILNFPYDGFDDDIMELIKMSQEYVEETKKDETPRGLGYTEASVKLINRVALLTCKIDKRVSSYIDSVNLDGDLAAIQGCIEAVGIVPSEEVARGENTGTAVHM